MRVRRKRARSEDALSAVFGALSDPTRRAMLDRLRAGPRSVSELGAPFRMSQPTISKHLKVLEKAGLVIRGRDAQLRPRTIQPAPLQVADEWMEPFRAMWDERLDRLELYIRKLQSGQ